MNCNGINVVNQFQCNDIKSWNNATNSIFCQMQYSTMHRDFFGQLDVQHLGPLRLVHLTSTAHRAERTVKQTRNDSEDSLLVAFQLNGTGKVEQHGRQAVISNLAFSMFETGRPYFLSFDAPFEHLVIHVPRYAIDRRVPGISRLTARSISGRKGEGALFASFMLGLVRESMNIDATNAERFAEIGMDLLAAALSDHPRYGSSSQLFRLKARLLNNMRDGAVDIACIAAKEGLSLRTAQRLFHAEGTSPTAWLMIERLRRAAADLKASSTPITQIAFSCGFNNLSHFDRAFHRQFGHSPRDYRNIHCLDSDRSISR